MSEIVVFDLKRVSTVIAMTDKVHIQTSGGVRTLCGLRIGRAWSENYHDRQPQCIACRKVAYDRPLEFPFTKLVQPL